MAARGKLADDGNVTFETSKGVSGARLAAVGMLSCHFCASALRNDGISTC